MIVWLFLVCTCFASILLGGGGTSVTKYTWDKHTQGPEAQARICERPEYEELSFVMLMRWPCT